MSTEKKIDNDSLCYYITQKVKDVRFELNCTQAEFSEKTGVAKSLIEKYERRVHSIPPKTLEGMAKKLSKDIENFFPESTNCISSEDKKSFDLVQTLKRIKGWKARDAVCVLTRFLSEGIQISKITEEIRPISYQMAQKAKDWRFARGRTQMEVADKSGMPHGQVVRYEKGEVSFKIAPKIAKGLSLHSGALLPTSKAESYFEDEDAEGEKKILSIMREYQKIDNKKLKDLWHSFLTEAVKIIEEESKKDQA